MLVAYYECEERLRKLQGKKRGSPHFLHKHTSKARESFATANPSRGQVSAVRDQKDARRAVALAQFAEIVEGGQLN